jgi:hypothetical protein
VLKQPLYQFSVREETLCLAIVPPRDTQCLALVGQDLAPEHHSPPQMRGAFESAMP